MNCWDRQIPRHIFLNWHDSSLGGHVNAASRKSSETQAQSDHKTKNPFGENICTNITFQLPLYFMKAKSQEDQHLCTSNFSDVNTFLNSNKLISWVMKWNVNYEFINMTRTWVKEEHWVSDRNRTHGLASALSTELRELMESKVIYLFHVWQASCMLLTSALGLS